MSAPPKFPLRPLGTGELLDRALGVYRAQFKELFKLSLAFALAGHILGKLYELLAFAKFPLLVQLHSFVDVPPLDQYLPQGLWALGSFIGLLATSICIWQASVAAVSAPAEAAPGTTAIRAIDAWRKLVPRLPALAYTLLLELLLILANVLVGALPLGLGIVQSARDPSNASLALLALGMGLSMFFMLGLFLVALLRYLLVPSVVMVEQLSGWAALRRASALMRGRTVDPFWLNPKVRGSLVLLVLGLASNAVLLVATAPRSLVLAANPGTNPNTPIMLIAEVLEVLASSAIQPFGMVALAIFYLDIRVRREGLDLQQAAAKMAKAA